MENTYPEETNPCFKKNSPQKFQYYKHLGPQPMKTLHIYSAFDKLLFYCIIVAIVGLFLVIYMYG